MPREPCPRGYASPEPPSKYQDDPRDRRRFGDRRRAVESDRRSCRGRNDCSPSRARFMRPTESVMSDEKGGDHA
jgi:hypothetical protein